MSKRLYIVTGKGGVGKTTISLSLARFLKTKKRKNVVYCSFEQLTNFTLCEELKIPYLELCTSNSIDEYIENKLGSKLISSWVTQTALFKSVFNMIPGLSHVIHLGHVVRLLEESDDLTVVLDLPSSGHAKTIFESSHNFKNIFKTGILVKDIQQMHDFLHQEENTKVIISSNPNYMPVHESIELKEFLHELNLPNIGITINESLEELNDVESKHLPLFLKKKVQTEKKIQKEFGHLIDYILPHQTVSDMKKLINRMTPLMENLL